MSTVSKILEYLNQQRINFDNLDDFTTVSISEKLIMSRTSTSEYLNSLVKDGKAVRIKSRPVYYLPVKKLEEVYNLKIDEFEFLSIEALKRYLDTNANYVRDFDFAIGCNGSLMMPISSLKSAVSYPTSLPVIIFGKKGTGKKYLAKLALDYLRNNNLCDKKSKFIYYDLSKESFEDVLIDIKKNEKQIQKGLIYLNSVSSLSLKQQKELALTIETIEKLKIIVSSEQDADYLEPELLFEVPVRISLPLFVDRSEDEKKQFVTNLFREEEKKLNNTFLISRNLLNTLAKIDYSNNIDDLKKTIVAVCANAYDRNANPIEVDVKHLPVEFYNYVSFIKKDELITLDMYEASSFCDNVIDYMNLLLNYNKELGDVKDYDGTRSIMRQFYEMLEKTDLYSDEKIQLYERTLSELINSLEQNRGINLPLNSIHVLARLLILEENSRSQLARWQSKVRESLRSLFEDIKTKLINEYILEEKIANAVQNGLNIQLSIVSKVIIMLNIHYFNSNIKNQKITGIVLSHGISTASSIAIAVNTLLESQVFEAIDMSLDTTVDEVANRVNLFVKNNPYLTDIVLLVDMGSLEKLDTLIENRINIGIINNVSTATALNVGSMILQERELEEILKKTVIESACHYKLIHSKQYERAIVFASDTGVQISERLVSLFKKSLPKKIDLVMVAYDYKQLKEIKTEDAIFQKYDVALLISSKGIDIGNVDNISLEEVMSFEKNDVFRKVLGDYLNEEELDLFETKLLKNFTLESIVNNLTILNPTRLLDDVSISINNLQQSLGHRFKPNTVIGISMHVCFMIERLMTHSEIQESGEESEFEENEKDFISNVDKSFERIYSTYNIKIPTSEMIYLFDYIKND